MSTSAVSTSSLYQELQSYFATRKSDLQQLGQALQSGNLADAQAAYNTITTLGKGGPFASGDPFRLSQREQAFAAVGQALQSGDLAGAQKAFAQLTSGQGQKAANPPLGTPVSTSGPEIILNLSSGSSSGAANPPVGTPISSSGTAANPPLGTPITSSGPEIILNLSSASGSSASASPEQITINISQPSQGGSEQVSLSVGNQQGSNAQEITFNLNPNSQEQIVINLLQASSSSAALATAPAGTTASGGINVSA